MRKPSPTTPKRSNTKMDDPALKPQASRLTPQNFLTPLLLVLLTCLAFAPALRAGFVWDDNTLIVKQPGVIDPDPLRGLTIIWTGAAKIDYFPLTETTFWIEHHLWGDASLGYHLDNILLHAANVVLLWLLLKRLKIPGAAIAAAIFAVHPLLVESVVWASERKNTLSLLFFLITLLFWLAYQETHLKRWLGCAIAAFALALFAKTSVVMLPFDLLLLEWFRRGKITRRTLLETIPFFALSIILGLVTVHFQSGQGLDPITMHRSLLERIAQAGINLTFYIYKLLVPLDLATVYPDWHLKHLDPLTFLPITLWIIALATLAITALRTKRPALRGLAAGVFFFVLNLLPVLGILNMAWSAVSVVGDHFAYLPMLGLLPLVGAAAATILTHRPSLRLPLSFAGAALAFACIALTWQQTSHYRSLMDIWRYNVAVRPNSAIAHNNLGLCLNDAGDPDAAAVQWADAVALDPQLFTAQSALGQYLTRVGRYADAMPYLRAAINIHPDDLASVSHLAECLWRTGDVADANNLFKTMIARYPDISQIYLAFGSMSEDSGQLPQAITAYQKAAALDPTAATPCYNLGNALYANNQLLPAAAAYEEAIKRDPTKAQAWFNLGVVLHFLGHDPQALQAYEHAIALDPTLAQRARP